MSAVVEGLLSEIEERLAALHFSFEPKLNEACRYLLLNPGKRVRPLLAIGAGLTLGAKKEELLLPACALETLHTYSLIHDDLPCMDDDDFRRGKPSLHKAFDEATALLAGDCLLTCSFEILANAPHLSAHTKLSLIQELARASGGSGMCGGQMLDLSADRELRKEELNSKKTGELFVASLRFGALIGAASKEEFLNFSHFGEKFGLLFQLCDDIADGEKEKKGSWHEVEHLHSECKTIFKKFSLPHPLLAHFVEELVSKV